jgi:WD40 repeat protein
MKLNLRRLSQWQVQHQISSFIFHPKKENILIGDKLGNINICDFKSGKKLVTQNFHRSPVIAMEFCGDYLYTLDKLQNLVSWDLETSQSEQTHSLCMKGWENRGISWPKTASGIPWTVATALFTSDGKNLIFGVNSAPRAEFSGFSTLYLIETQTASLLREFEFITWDVGTIDSIAISRDNTQLAASGLDVIYSSVGDWSACSEHIHQWCIKTAELVCKYAFDPIFSPSEHEDISLVFSADTRKVLSFSESYSNLWNVPPLDSRDLTVVDERELFLSGVADWSPVSNLVASGSLGGHLTLVDMAEFENQVDIAEVEILFEERIFQSEIQQIRFSRTGEFLAVFCKDLTFEVWQIDYL